MADSEFISIEEATRFFSSKGFNVTVTEDGQWPGHLICKRADGRQIRMNINEDNLIDGYGMKRILGI